MLGAPDALLVTRYILPSVLAGLRGRLVRKVETFGRPGYCWPIGVGAVPGEALPEILLFPKEKDGPRIAVPV